MGVFADIRYVNIYRLATADTDICRSLEGIMSVRVIVTPVWMNSRSLDAGVKLSVTAVS